MLRSYERSLQPGLVGAGRIVPVESLAGSQILILRHQLNIQRRQSPKRLNFSTLDQIVLALEIEASRRPADGAAGNTRADPRDEYRQSTLGSATNSWRASQARHRDRTDQRGQVYGQAERPAIPGLEDVPPQSCRRHRGDGSVRRTDDLISVALRMVDDRFYGSALPRIRPLNGSQIKSRKRAAGSRPLAN